MDNPWRFGWEAIGAIAGVLALIGFVVVEWPRIGSERLKGRSAVSGFYVVGFGVGYLLPILSSWRLLVWVPQPQAFSLVPPYR
jgi:hypothetical protein